MKMEQSVPKLRHIKFRRRGITQKKAYNIQNTAKVLNQESLFLFHVCYMPRPAQPLLNNFHFIISAIVCSSVHMQNNMSVTPANAPQYPKRLPSQLLLQLFT
jgi:hypothetical protein